MFVIWRGWGILLPVGAAIGAIIGLFIAQAVTGPQSTGLIPAFLFLFASLGAYGVVRICESTDKGRAVIDKETGQEILLKRGDSGFFIKVRYWFYLLSAITVLIFVLNLIELFSN